jgi:HAD superfamily hydrolase (TIGR01450 family)
MRLTRPARRLPRWRVTRLAAERFKLVILDLDGVVYLGDQLIPGAREAVEALLEAGLAVRYMTNNSYRTRLAYTRKLRRLGIPARESDIYTSGYVTARQLFRNGARGKRAFVIGGPGLRHELELVGLELVEEPPADYVVTGFDPRLSYHKLATAFHCYLGGAKLVASNRDRSFPSDAGHMPAGGTMAAAVEHCCGARAKAYGKPEASSLLAIVREAGAERQAALMVGDRLDTDVLAAGNAGLRSALVLTGSTSEQEARAARGKSRPTWILSSIAELPELVLAGRAPG